MGKWEEAWEPPAPRGQTHHPNSPLPPPNGLMPPPRVQAGGLTLANAGASLNGGQGLPSRSVASLRSGSQCGRNPLLPVGEPHPRSALLSPSNGHSAHLTFLDVAVKL